MTRRTRWGSASRRGPMAPTPALLTRISSPPNFDWAASMHRCRAAGSVTSPATHLDRPPRAVDLLGQFAQAVFAPGHADDLAALPGQFQRHRPADAAGGAGHDRSAALRCHVSSVGPCGTELPKSRQRSPATLVAFRCHAAERRVESVLDAAEVVAAGCGNGPPPGCRGNVFERTSPWAAR